MNKQECKRFEQGMFNLLKSMGGHKTPCAWHEWEVPTKCGVYRCSVRTESGKYGMLNLFGRFDNIEQAKTIVDCNPYSGKWNFHYNTTAAEALTLITFWLDKVRLDKPCQ